MRHSSYRWNFPIPCILAGSLGSETFNYTSTILPALDILWFCPALQAAFVSFPTAALMPLLLLARQRCSSAPTDCFQCNSPSGQPDADEQPV